MRYKGAESRQCIDRIFGNAFDRYKAAEVPPKVYVPVIEALNIIAYLHKRQDEISV
jgi:hypothetical protein